MILLKIAFRNLREHKIKTLIIGSLIALGIAFLVIGNSVSQTITNGMEKTYTDNFTGDIIFRNTSDNDVVFIGGFGGRIPALENLPEIEAELASHEAVEQFTPMLTGAGTISHKDETVGFSILWSVKVDEYRKMFNTGFTVVEGTDLQEGERGIVLSKTALDTALEEYEIELKVGDIVQLTSINDTTGTKIREVPIVGIGQYENEAGTLGGVSFVDASTLRSLAGLTAFKETTKESVEELTEEPVEGEGESVVSELVEGVSIVDELAEGNSIVSELADESLEEQLIEEALTPDVVEEVSFEDSLFGDTSSSEDNLFGEDSLFGDDLLADATTTDSGLDFENILGDTSVREKYLALDNNAWHFMLVKLKDGFSTDAVKKELTATTAEIAENAVVENWRFGAGFFAGLASAFSVILNVLIVVVALVAVIIIMNTLVISVTERFGEIGTVRAIGGQRGFVRSMITLEVLMITIIFGIIGIIIGIAIIALLNSVGLKAPNEFLEIFFGGPTLRPTLSAISVVVSFFVMVVIGIFASLYPVSVALGISPVQAMQSK